MSFKLRIPIPHTNKLHCFVCSNTCISFETTGRTRRLREIQIGTVVRCLFAALSLQQYAQCSQREEIKIFQNTTLYFARNNPMILNDKIKNDWVDRFCNTRGKQDQFEHLLRVSNCKRPNGGYRLTQKDRPLGLQRAGVEWLQLTQDRMQQICYQYCNESRSVQMEGVS